MISQSKYILRSCVFALLSMFGSTYEGMCQVAREVDTSTKSVQNRFSESSQDLLAEKLFSIQNSADLVQRGSATVLEGEHLGAIQYPVGGIGSGCIQFDGKAVPIYWQIFNNMSHDFVPNSFMLLRTIDGDDIQVRALQTENLGQVKGMESLKCRNEFPFLSYEFQDNLPVNVHMCVYNPFIPMNLKDSSIPAVFYHITLTNPGNRAIEVDLLSSQQNAVGLTSMSPVEGGNSFADGFANCLKRKLAIDNRSSLYANNYNYAACSGKNHVLFMESEKNPADEHFGQMALVLLDGDQQMDATSVTASWQNYKRMVGQFQKQGKLKAIDRVKPSAKGTTYTGAITTKITLKPRETKELNLAMCWYFPNGINGGVAKSWDGWGKGRWIGTGNWYASQWSNIKELVDYVVANQKRLYTCSSRFHDSFFETNLPYWAVERLASQFSVLRSRTIFHDKNNYVGLWEGCGSNDGACAGNCNHVWHYAQAHAHMFPAMARQIRKQAYDTMKDNGQLAYRQPAGSNAFDGQCGEILATYREHLLSVDNEWLKGQYPRMKKALSYLIKTWDEDQDGWLKGAKHTTYDCSLSGNPSFLTSLYIVTLKAAAKMATVCDDAESASLWTEISKKAITKHNERLWNGEYYTQEIDSLHPNSDYGNGCHSDQLLGQWWADQLGLGELFPSHRVKQAFESIFKYNFRSILKDHKQLQREFVKPNDAGLIVCTWPHNDRPKNAIAYPDEIWTSQEYNLAANLFKYNEPIKALTLLWAGNQRYNGVLKTGYHGDWGNFGFSGNPFGDDECGQFYSRSLCNWSILNAIQGFRYNAPEASIAFSPKWQPENHKSFFATAEGWGNFSQIVVANKQVNTLSCNYGTMHFRELTLPNLLSSGDENIVVTLNGIPVKTTVKQHSESIILSFEDIHLRENDCLMIKCN